MPVVVGMLSTTRYLNVPDYYSDLDFPERRTVDVALYVHCPLLLVYLTPLQHNI